MEEALQRLKEAFARDLLRLDHLVDKPFLYSSKTRRKYTRRELCEEISNNTDTGNDMIIMLLNLSADLLLRQKVNPPEDIVHEQE